MLFKVQPDRLVFCALREIGRHCSPGLPRRSLFQWRLCDSG